MKGKQMQINDLKKNQVIDLELKNGSKITVQFKGASNLVEASGKLTNTKLINVARIELDQTKPQPTEFEMFAVNMNQIKAVEINQAVADKLDRVLWNKSAQDATDLFNKVDWSKIDWNEDKLNKLQEQNRQRVLGKN
jgi:hypothetical protein